jgi:hypothetical protein
MKPGFQRMLLPQCQKTTKKRHISNTGRLRNRGNSPNFPSSI